MKTLIFGYHRRIPELPRILQESGVDVIDAEDDEDALSLLSLGYEMDAVTCVLLDESNPPFFVSRMRRISDLPLIILTPLDKAQVRTTFLKQGADCVLSFPLDKHELQAYIIAAVRRYYKCVFNTVEIGNVVVDLSQQCLHVNNEEFYPTRTQWTILETLVLHRGRTVYRDHLLERLYVNPDKMPEVKVLDVFVCKIRKKIRDMGGEDIIQSVWGRGYRINGVNDRQTFTAPLSRVTATL